MAPSQRSRPAGPFCIAALGLALFAGCAGTGSSPEPPCDGPCTACHADDECGDGGVCQIDAGTCVECNGDADCHGATPSCDPARHRCVACLPAADHCAAGTYCTPEGDAYRCAPGCNVDRDCATDAGGIHACCDHRCVDESGDVAHCGACATACAQGQGCCGGACSSPGTDVKNCGGCGVACNVPDATAVCAQAQCRVGGCDAGWADCNGDPRDGCELHVDVDPMHCGACASACSGANGMATCAGGKCGISCSAGFANCDGDVTNGCETNTNTAVMACGACNAVCAPAHATPQCAAGQCKIASCEQGWLDCNGDPKDGCEVHGAVDVANCGACKKACSAKNGMPMCNGGACQISCAMGFANCDNDVTNGCEVNFTTDANNCSACGAVCKLANATPACAMSACAISSCNPGYTDCNKIPNDGCEVNTGGDIDNCGGCGAVCSSQNGAPSCSQGACKIVCTAGFGDCDGKIATGCETSIYTDAGNCGACGKTCSGNNVAMTSCGMGVCNGACNPGYYDCNGNKQVDGCESFTATDAKNCGTCGTICSNQHIAAPTCGMGVCNGACDALWGDCNGNKQPDGCETSLNTAQNCGACGAACGMGFKCINGFCEVACSVKINEVVTGTVLNNGVGGGSDEWVEVYNPCNAAVNLTGWRLVYRSANNNSGGADISLYGFNQTIAAGAYLLIAGMNYSGAAMVDGQLTNSMAAAGGAVGIKDANQVLIDSVAWDMLVQGVPNSFTEGTPAPNPPTVAIPGNSIARLPNGQDTNNNTNDFKVSGAPTPRAPNM